MGASACCGAFAQGVVVVNRGLNLVLGQQGDGFEFGGSVTQDWQIGKGRPCGGDQWSGPAKTVTGSRISKIGRGTHACVSVGMHSSQKVELTPPPVAPDTGIVLRRYHPLADRLEICFAKRGNKSRTQAFRAAIEKAEARFESQYGIRRSAVVDIVASTPPERAGLQAVDYLLWALQRHYERGESRYLELVWAKVVEIEDMDRIEGGRKGVVYNKKRPLVTDQGASE